jgi:hypothetical protein
MISSPGEEKERVNRRFAMSWDGPDGWKERAELQRRVPASCWRSLCRQLFRENWFLVSAAAAWNSTEINVELGNLLQFISIFS